MTKNTTHQQTIEAKRAQAIPRHYTRVPVEGETDLLVYGAHEHNSSDTGNNQERWTAICFTRQSFRPRWHYTFQSEAARQSYITRDVAARTEHQATVCARRAKRYQPHTLVVGDVLVSSWGYDQTNVDFYEVRRCVGKTEVEVAKAPSVVVSESVGAERVIPGRAPDTAGTWRVRVNGASNSATIDRNYASQWNGQPCHQTAWGWGH